MSTQHVRPTAGPQVVVVASKFNHRQGHNQGRLCPVCGAVWTVDTDANENFHVWRDGQPSDSSILDWTGNNVAVECCGPGGGRPVRPARGPVGRPSG